MKAPTIVFDLDGTLVDTAPDLVSSLNHTIAVAGLSPVGYGDLTHLVGHGARAMIARAFALRGVPLAEEELQPLLDRFIDHYTAGMPGESQPYPGLVDALGRLREAGFRLAVCTNKMEGLAVPLIEKLGLTHHFAAIAGGDTFAVPSPIRPSHGNDRAAGGDRPSRHGRRQHQRHPGRQERRHPVRRRVRRFPIVRQELGADRLIRHFDELTPSPLSG